ncbi:TetR/AcrR family transcriptional regulator [Shewanella salipaludis]|uniref:TetR/AcrR family transcriptional regulator n=1 Tax=Shewanella salipaludis TaxID=2723052 RepID=A0A972FT16_9GAMM|nr:TetR/AcrR family transcriptional regulator [Shewanella salipaludis]NMH65688.1 TetR/AcrR family transcriptional regulator [Shewanella salipaludis]
MSLAVVGIGQEQGQDKRQQLVAAAFRLFYVHSIHGIGINQILQESGIAKKTLYHHFSGKDELIEAVVSYRHQVFYLWLSERMQAATAGLAAIEAMFTALDDWFNDRVPCLHDFRGCFFINSCAEFTDAGHPVHKLCVAHKDSIIGLIGEQVTSLGLAREAGLELTEALGLLKEGAIVSAQLRDKTAALRARSLAKALVQGYLARQAGGE